MSEEEFASYFEDAFRYHNQVMNELIEFASDLKDHSPRDTSRLPMAEKEMISACEPLNEAVTETLEGHDLSLKIKLRLADAVPECRRASEVVDQLIAD